jgi:hypothetical protein
MVPFGDRKHTEVFSQPLHSRGENFASTRSGIDSTSKELIGVCLRCLVALYRLSDDSKAEKMKKITWRSFGELYGRGSVFSMVFLFVM